MHHFIISIGGTGMRCLESFVHLCAMGMMDDCEIDILTLDTDAENGNRVRVEQLIDQYNIGSHITLCPPTKDMDTVYRGASIVAMSSRYEGLPMILLEAQAYGLPIVSHACKCGPADVVTDGVDGFLVPEGDIEALASKLTTVIEDDALRQQMGQAARIASERYAEDVVMKKWIDLFERVKG